MKLALKRSRMGLILIAFLVVSLALMPTVYSEASTAQEKSLAFLEEVVNLDLTKYNAKIDNYAESSYLSMSQESIVYTLDGADESKLHVMCIFRDRTLSSCIIDVLKGSPIHAEAQSTNVIALAKGFLQRYQSFAGASYLQAMHNMLDTVNEVKNTTTAMDDVKFTLSIRDVWTDPDEEPITDTSFEWIQTVNGVDAPQNAVSITFRDGSLYWFKDDWNLYKIGNSSINVSREEAIEIAMEAAKDYKLQVYTAENTLTDIEFNIVDESLTAECFMYPKETLTLHPFWQVQLYFDKYYASYFGIKVGIWADTKEIMYCQATGTSGGLPYGETSTALPTNSSPQPKNNSVPLIEMAIFTIALSTIIVTAIVAIAIKKKRK